MKQTIVFEGEITTKTPYASSPPTQGKKDKTKPSWLPKMTIRLEDQHTCTVPYISASTIKGALRRIAVEATVESLMKQNGGKSSLTIEDFLLLVLGGIKGDDKEDQSAVIETLKLRADNPIISLFGSSVPWMFSSLWTGHAIPTSDVNTAVVSGVRSNDMKRAPALLAKILPVNEIARFENMADVNSDRSEAKKRLDEVKADLLKPNLTKQEITDKEEKKVELESKIKGYREDAGSSNSFLMPLPGYEVIPPGHTLAHSFVLRNVEPYEIGLFLQTLNRFGQLPRLGAHLSVGCGEIAATYRVTQIGEGTSLGIVDMKPHEGIVWGGKLPKLVEDASKAWQAKLLEMDFSKLRAPKINGKKKKNGDDE